VLPVFLWSAKDSEPIVKIPTHYFGLSHLCNGLSRRMETAAKGPLLQRAQGTKGMKVLRIGPRAARD